ncbi:uncharacterized protein H6S33_006627 [Morchella sextelata]|uniref:uncharacterized protein n=1 Tax=Morchella sextelata TaxID=1174677 RepID=UPI001D049797|nr:uncharacterized protein H6S33_006627 [Morchella sextelata]KAH0604250.1 hypothetical protein H6S33_006627 [Morchella sextelata]
MLIPCAALLLASATLCHALGEQRFISFTSPGVSLLSAPILVDEEDFKGVHIAAQSLSDDFRKVTGQPAGVQNYTGKMNAPMAIIVGSLGQSGVVDGMVKEGRVNVTGLEGQWESFMTAVVEKPVKGVDRALVIVGSDKRGTIFGVYTLSEQIGVSPWYWWADVVPQKRKEIYALPVRTHHGEPSIRYRGIFINDEAPSLTSFVLDKFGPVYNAEFYKHVFELLLRMKANYLWPAMWPSYPEPGNSFFVDDPLNQATADEYGIVISTSHHEPMQRATNEWLTSGQGSWDWTSNKAKISDFFRVGAERARGFESYFTMGMRGAGDSGISGADPLAILEEVITTQRDILKENGEEDVKQVWALYKEVQAYYEQGLEVPEDVTLLFADDNFGTIRRLPTEAEKERSGGIGVYYHLEFVGSPRSYKWMNTNSLGKVWQQLNTAWLRGADQIWVINVADIKPMELPLSLIMTMAWNGSYVTKDSIPDFLETYASREFGAEYAKPIANLLLGHSRLVGLRRHESIEAETFSILNYNEAERVLGQWKNLSDTASALYSKIPDSSKPAFFQLVLHPIKASYTFLDVKVSLAKNSVYARQRRNSANKFAENAIDKFNDDFDLTEEYHSLLGGKWNHIMGQAHYGFTSAFHPPSRDMISGLSYVQVRQDTVPALGQMGVGVEGTIGVRPGLFNEGSDLAKPSRDDLAPGFLLPPIDPYGADRYIEVYARGTPKIQWSVKAQYSWIILTPSSGTLTSDRPDQRIEISVNWADVPTDFIGKNALIYVNSTLGDYEEVRLPVNNRKVPDGFNGFVETDGHVSMEAAHFTASTQSPLNSSSPHYETLPYLGSRTNSGGIALYPGTSPSQSPPESPYLDYSVYLFSQKSTVNVTLYFTTTLDTDPVRPLMYAVSFDQDAPANKTRLLAQPATAGDLPSGWTDAARDGVWRKSHTFESSGAGSHRIRYWALEPGIILEKVLVDLGGVRGGYLGPPESMKI